MSTNYVQMAKDFKVLVGQLGIKKAELEALRERPAGAPQVEEAARKLEGLTAQVQTLLAQAQVPDDERARKLKELDAELDLLDILAATNPDPAARVVAQREIARLTARRGVYQAQAALRFEHLLDTEKIELKELLLEAQKDIRERQNLARVLKATEVVLRIAVFSATLAAKLA